MQLTATVTRLYMPLATSALLVVFLQQALRSTQQTRSGHRVATSTSFSRHRMIACLWCDAERHCTAGTLRQTVALLVAAGADRWRMAAFGVTVEEEVAAGKAIDRERLHCARDAIFHAVNGLQSRVRVRG